MKNLNYTHIALAALVVVAVLGGVVLAISSNSDSADIQVVAPTPIQQPSFAPTQSANVGVYISGAVERPGVYIVGDGNRLAHIVLLAGGATADADLAAVNLATIVRDEDHWHIPKRGEPEAAHRANGHAMPDAGLQGATNDDGRINLNTATAETLMQLPGIGEIRANAIVDYREENGDFPSVDALTAVPGIGVGILDDIRHLIAVE